MSRTLFGVNHHTMSPSEKRVREPQKLTFFRSADSLSAQVDVPAWGVITYAAGTEEGCPPPNPTCLGIAESEAGRARTLSGNLLPFLPEMNPLRGASSTCAGTHADRSDKKTNPHPKSCSRLPVPMHGRQVWPCNLFERALPCSPVRCRSRAGAFTITKGCNLPRTGVTVNRLPIQWRGASDA